MSRLVLETKKIIKNRFAEKVAEFVSEEEFDDIAEQTAQHVLRLVFLNFAEIHGVDLSGLPSSEYGIPNDSLRGHLGNIAQILTATYGGEMGSHEFGVLMARVRGVLQTIDEAVIVR